MFGHGCCGSGRTEGPFGARYHSRPSAEGAAVHDDRTLVGARLERAMGQFVRPAQYAERVPLVLSVWHVPGEPVPVDQAPQADYETLTTGTA